MTVGTGVFSGPVEALRTMLSQCTAFQQFCGVVTEEAPAGSAAAIAAALTHTYPIVLVEADADTEETRTARRPLAVVQFPYRLRCENQGSSNGAVPVLFERLRDTEATEQNDLLAFGNSLDAIRSGLFSPDHLNSVASMEVLEAPGILKEHGSGALTLLQAVLGFEFMGAT